MTTINKLFFLICFLGLSLASRAQFTLTEVTKLGKLSPTHLSYYPDNKEWILSNGYYVFQAWNDFNDAKLLFNSYPYYQFALERFPNKNFFSRHFDTKSPPYGFEYRAKRLDSSRVYIMGDTLKKINKLSPSTFVKVTETAKNGSVITSAANNCFPWGKDSAVFCNNGTIRIERKINGKDSVHLRYTTHTITAVDQSADGDYAVAGTKDSGWYFIPTQQPGNYRKIDPKETDSEIKAFYFDDAQQQIWVQEGALWYNAFKSMSLYDYSSGQPVFIKTIKAETFGLSDNNDARFSFDFQQNKVYVKDGLRSLIQFDLKSETVTYDFFRDLEAWSVTTVHSIFFNTTDKQLYIAAGKYDSTFSNSNNFLFRAEVDTNAFVNFITPKNKTDKNQLYPDGLNTVVNRLPVSQYSAHNNISLASNGLALIPYDKNEYMLYNIRNGNMILAFQAANIDLNAKSRFSRENTANLSPSGRFIFEWMVKAGISAGIADTLQVALTNVLTGSIKRNKLVLSSKTSERIESFYWDGLDRPVFVKKFDGKYPDKIIQTFYLDTALQAQIINQYSFVSDEVLYNAWQIPESKNYLLKTGRLGGDKFEQYSLVSSSKPASLLLYSGPTAPDLMLNCSGWLMPEPKGDAIAFHWYDTSGRKLHTSILPKDYRIQQLIGSSLYCIDGGGSNAVKVNLLNGDIRPLQYKTKPDYNFSVSPDESLLVCVSDKIQTWQLQQDTLCKLYELQAENNFVKYTQLTNKYLVSDGRIWNLSTGFLVQADLASKAILNDSLQLSTIYSGDIIEDAGWGLNENERYRLKPYQKLFVNSIANAKNLKTWRDSFDRTLVATIGIFDNALQNIYELPFSKDVLDEIKIYPVAGQHVALVVKSKFKIIDTDMLTSPPDDLLLLDLETGKYPALLTGKIVKMKQMPGNGPFLFYLLNQKTKAIQAYKIENNAFKKIEHLAKLDVDALYKLNIVDEQSIVYMEGNAAVFHNLLTDTKEQVRFNYISGNFSMSSYLYYDVADKSLFIGYSEGGILKIKDNKVVECVRSVPGLEGFAGTKGKYLLAMDKLGNYYFINKETLEADLRLLTWKGVGHTDRKYMWLTRENYYMATPGVESNIHFADKSRAIPLKQGDLQYNRPDKVLEYLGGPQTEIDFYRQLHQIRLKKYDAVTQSSSVTSSVQFNSSIAIAGKQLSLTAQATGPEKINKLQVVVNGCPLYLKPVTTANGKELKQTISIPLNAGPNNIYAWAEDVKGNRSHFAELKVSGEFADSGKWHFVGVGVSRYKDSLQNLRYADKDIRDIAAFMARAYPGISIDTLFNENVTAVNIQRLGEQLKNTHPDDKVMVSFSGHGLLDEQKKFWYATHDIDFSKPQQNGIAMSAITALLENIPARYRMITLDACHSGDVVSGFTSPAKTEVIPAPSADAGTIKGTTILNQKNDNNPSAALLLKSMQMVFTDQLSNSGINLIAASSGTEYALEGEKWKNGVFSYALINGWGYAARKESYNKQVHYRDLKQYLQQTVSALTNGRQTPNTVMENGEIDWWLIPEK